MTKLGKCPTVKKIKSCLSKSGSKLNPVAVPMKQKYYIENKIPKQRFPCTEVLNKPGFVASTRLA